MDAAAAYLVRALEAPGIYSTKHYPSTGSGDIGEISGYAVDTASSEPGKRYRLDKIWIHPKFGRRANVISG